MKNLKSRLIMFVLLVGLVFSGYKIVDYFYTSYDEKQNFNNVEKLVESEYEDEKIQYNDFEILKKYKKVYEKNNDLVGWIKIKNTNI
jgi:sortase B